MDEVLARRLLTLAGVIALASLIILVIDMGIKRQVVAEAVALREVIAGGTVPGSQARSREAGGNPGFRRPHGADDAVAEQARQPQSRATARGGGIKSSPVIAEPAGRPHVNGDRTDVGHRVVPGPAVAQPGEGYGDANV